MNLPNTLTIARIFFVPLLVAVLVQERIILHWNGAVITNDVVALIIFWVAAATDLLDGYLARRWGQVTTIGTLLDPIADKLLVSAALISLVQVTSGPRVAGRAAGRQRVRGVGPAQHRRRGRLHHQERANSGKTKTFWQVLAISLLMISMHHPWVRKWADFRFTSWCYFPSGPRSRTSTSSGARSISAPSRDAARNC